MKILNVPYLSHPVTVYLQNNILEEITTLIDKNHQYFILTDENVASLYLNKLVAQLPHVKTYTLPSGEKYKTLSSVEEIITKMLAANISKGDYLIAFGGGVISDLGGFIASIYKRGLKYYNLPTTLLAQVDACLGGKTGIDFVVNYNLYKNQLGTIYHPEMIIVDPSLLKSLPQKEYLSGLGEIIKYGVCFDKELFQQLFTDFDLSSIIYQALAIKAKITSRDEFEQHGRYTLNFGHTFGHAIESYFKMEIPHGLAVAYGMLYEIKNEVIKDQLRGLYQKLGITINQTIKKDELINYLLQDKKIASNIINLPVLDEIGQVKLVKMSLNDFIRSIE